MEMFKLGKREPLFDDLGHMIIREADSLVTQSVKRNWNTLTESQFLRMYSASKDLYKQRVIMYGDPYMNSPLAKLGKWLAKKR